MVDSVIISLTSVPPRFGGLQRVLASLLAQGAHEVRLTVPYHYDRFPDWDGVMPGLPAGVVLVRTQRDQGPATKLQPALAGTACGAPVLICDDDAIYGPGWVGGFVSAATEQPGAAIAASAFSAGRLALEPRAPDNALIAQGFAGVLLPGGALSGATITERDRFVDDIWLSATLTARGVPIIYRPELRALVAPFAAPAPLQHCKPGGTSRSEANLRAASALRREMGVWMP